MAITFDPDNAAQQTARRKLDSDHIAWLTTIRADGRPHSVPVWFLWDDGRIVLFSEPETVKVRNIRRNQAVGFHLQSTSDGGEVVILDGTAQISETPASDWIGRVGETYQRKYADGLKGLGLTLEQMAAQYSTVIEITPAKLSAW